MMGGRVWLRLALASTLPSCVAADFSRMEADSAVLVQAAAVRKHNAQSQTKHITDAVLETPKGPVAHTMLGEVTGASEEGYYIFRGVPYAETPPRFHQCQEKKPWAPTVYNAKVFKPACIGSHTSLFESEDCHHLNIWLPKGGLQNLPVIVYFHGGMNQHGSGDEVIRHGDLIVQSKKFPSIFINFDYRLGIFGWIHRKNSTHIPNNLGMLDQQEALRWIQRNIAAFGGDPSRVTLQGQSEGCGTILAHLVAPGSRSLFHRVVMHSPVVDMWDRNVNEDRTKFMIDRVLCNLAPNEMDCLRQKPAQELWSADWNPEELSRLPFSLPWLTNAIGAATFITSRKEELTDLPGYLGWHPVVDGVVLPGEPRELIAQGRWHKVPVLMTVSKNESAGVFPPNFGTSGVEAGLVHLLKEGEPAKVVEEYKKTLEAAGIKASNADILHQMITDKVWTCEVRAVAHDMVRGGGEPYVGMFWHSPKYDPVGSASNPVCLHGATCHAAEMFYVLPQGRYFGIHGPHMEDEIEFARTYSNNFLAFVHGKQHPWQRFDESTEPMTFTDMHGTHVVQHYRKPQCDVLDASMNKKLPEFMQRRARELLLSRDTHQ